jgi:hypothetical protein
VYEISPVSTAVERAQAAAWSGLCECRTDLLAARVWALEAQIRLMVTGSVHRAPRRKVRGQDRRRPRELRSDVVLARWRHARGSAVNAAGIPSYAALLATLAAVVSVAWEPTPMTRASPGDIASPAHSNRTRKELAKEAACGVLLLQLVAASL